MEVEGSGAVTVVDAPRDIPGVRLAICSNSASVWWLNGEEVIGIYNDRQAVIDDGVSKRLTLKRGPNVIRAAVPTVVNRSLDAARRIGFIVRSNGELLSTAFSVSRVRASETVTPSLTNAAACDVRDHARWTVRDLSDVFGRLPGDRSDRV